MHRHCSVEKKVLKKKCWRALTVTINTGLIGQTDKYFLIIVKSTVIRLYLPFSDWFRTKRKPVWSQINRKRLTIIWFWLDSARIRKDVSVCSYSVICLKVGSQCECYSFENIYLVSKPLTFDTFKMQQVWIYIYRYIYICVCVCVCVCVCLLLLTALNSQAII